MMNARVVGVHDSLVGGSTFDDDDDGVTYKNSRALLALEDLALCVCVSHLLE